MAVNLSTHKSPPSCLPLWFYFIPSSLLIVFNSDFYFACFTSYYSPSPASAYFLEPNHLNYVPNLYYWRLSWFSQSPFPPPIFYLSYSSFRFFLSRRWRTVPFFFSLISTLLLFFPLSTLSNFSRCRRLVAAPPSSAPLLPVLERIKRLYLLFHINKPFFFYHELLRFVSCCIPPPLRVHLQSPIFFSLDFPFPFPPFLSYVPQCHSIQTLASAPYRHRSSVFFGLVACKLFFFLFCTHHHLLPMNFLPPQMVVIRQALPPTSPFTCIPILFFLGFLSFLGSVRCLTDPANLPVFFSYRRFVKMYGYPTSLTAPPLSCEVCPFGPNCFATFPPFLPHMFPLPCLASEDFNLILYFTECCISLSGLL